MPVASVVAGGVDGAGFPRKDPIIIRLRVYIDPSKL